MGFINRHKYKFFFIVILILILISSFFLLLVLKIEKNKFKEGVYVRKQFSQIVIYDKEEINFTFYSVKNVNYDFLNWNNLYLKNDNFVILSANEKNLKKSEINKLVKKIQFSIFINFDDKLNGNEINTLCFKNETEEINVEIGKILIYQIPSDKFLKNKLMTSINTANDYMSFSFTNSNDENVIIKEIFINNNSFHKNKILEKDETITIKYDFKNLIDNHFNYIIILIPYIKIEENEAIYFLRPGFHIVLNNLNNENQINDFIRNSTPFSTTGV